MQIEVCESSLNLSHPVVSYAKKPNVREEMTAFRILGYEYQRQSIKETVLSVVT
jgi:hypothetical protein